VIDSRLTVPARPEYTRVLRLVADGIAAEAGLDMDRIDDLELAIDEAAAALIEQTDSEELLLTLRREGPSVIARLSGDRSDGDLQIDALRSVVLAAVADEVTIDRGAITLRVGGSPD